MLIESPEKPTHRSLSHERWSTDVNPTKKALRPFRRFTPPNGAPRQSKWRPCDRKWFNHSSSALEKSGKQWRQEKLSFFLRGEHSATARCRFRRTRRNTEERSSPGFWTFRRFDLWIGPLYMWWVSQFGCWSTMLTWHFSFSERPRFVELSHARERVSTATG